MASISLARAISGGLNLVPRCLAGDGEWLSPPAVIPESRRGKSQSHIRPPDQLQSLVPGVERSRWRVKPSVGQTAFINIVDLYKKTGDGWPTGEADRSAPSRRAGLGSLAREERWRNMAWSAARLNRHGALIARLALSGQASPGHEPRRPVSYESQFDDISSAFDRLRVAMLRGFDPAMTLSPAGDPERTQKCSAEPASIITPLAD